MVDEARHDPGAVPGSQAPVAPRTDRGRNIALAVVLLSAGLAVAVVASPLWVGLMLGTVMAFSAQPLFRWLVGARLGRRLSAVVTTLIGALLLLLLTAVSIYVVVDELVAMSKTAELDVRSASSDWPRMALARVSRSFGLDEAALGDALEGALGDATSALAESAATVLKGISEAILSFVIALWTMYYVLVNWPRLAARLERMLPLDPRHTRALIIEFRDVGRSAFVGTVATALIQGLIAGAGYALAGLPHALALGVLTGIASFLPLLGTAFVFVPAAVYDIATGNAGRGVFVLVWSLALVVGFSDYVVRPRLVGTRNVTDPLLMLVALLGGLEVFGISGLIVGPMAMSLFLAVAHIYEAEVATTAAGTALEEYKRL